MNYNEKYESNIEELIKFYIEEAKSDEFLLNELKNKYRETDYPGYLYKIGLLYEQNILKTNNPREHIRYYSDAANKNYLDALIKIIEICFENIDYEITINSFYLNPIHHHLNLCSDPYGEYLLSKYKLMYSIMNDNYDQHILDALILMKHSADKGCEKAIEFMKNINSEFIENK